MSTLIVAQNLLLEASRRRWPQILALLITTMLVIVGFALKLEIVDGTLAAARLFGDLTDNKYSAVDVALRPLFVATSYSIFFGGLILGIWACADFAPKLFAPGRIEHLLSLPVKRSELLLGTFLGVSALLAALALYGTLGMIVVLGFKTGVWEWRLLLTGLFMIVCFGAIYAAMLTATIFARHTSVSASVGLLVLVLGTMAGTRDSMASIFESGFWRSFFLIFTAGLPRISHLAMASSAFVGGDDVDVVVLFKMSLGALIFAAGILAIGNWRFASKDY